MGALRTTSTVRKVRQQRRRERVEESRRNAKTEVKQEPQMRSDLKKPQNKQGDVNFLMTGKNGRKEKWRCGGQ